jgi:hypothetical protein
MNIANAVGLYKNQRTNLEHINKWEYTFSLPLEHVEGDQHAGMLVAKQGFPAITRRAILGKETINSCARNRRTTEGTSRRFVFNWAVGVTYLYEYYVGHCPLT